MARSLRAIKRVGGTFKAIGVLAVILSVLTVCVFAGAEAALANTDGAFDRVADTDTSGKYVDILGDANTLSTRYAGRVWTDKSVSAEESITFTGQGDDGQSSGSFEFSKASDADFLVTYSAMATSQQIIELPQIPVDVVFVLDFSASMTWGINSTTVSSPDGSDSRIKAMVDAMNQTIDALAKANPENRIGIVVFNAHAQEMLQLTKLTSENLSNVEEGNYLSLESFSGTEGEDNGESTVVCHIDGGSTIQTASKTNIQDGLFEGMNMLAEAQDTTFKYKGSEYTRIPNVVLMSDGAPTTISLAQDGWDNEDWGNAGSWWSNLENNNFWGDNNQAQSANGFMAMITAELLKNKIADHYEQNAANAQNADELNTRMYTIGFGINLQNKSMVAMANMVLNPEHMFNLSDNDIRNWNVGNQDATDNADDARGLNQVLEAREEWKTYAVGQNAHVHYVTASTEQNNPRSLTVEHPSDQDKASEWDNFGEAPSYVDAYYPADDAGALEDAFQEITNAIVDTAKVPTEIGNGSPVSSGYITYTDPIGEYMEVKDISGLLFGNTKFTVSGSEKIDQGIRYYFSSNGATSVDSPIYSDQNINNIIVTVSTDQTGTQTLTVQIPASLIPLRVNTVEVNADGQTVETHTTNNVYPLRLVYSVGLRERVIGDDGRVNEDVVSPDYINGHKLDDGSVAFYSNFYDGMKVMEDQPVGNATVTFTPANDNPFYFIQENTPLYTDQTCTTRATGQINPQETYYFRFNWYDADSLETTVISRPGSQLEGWTGSDAEGLYILEGAPRLGNLTDAVQVVAKGYENNTGTATHPYYPTFEGNPHEQGSQFTIYLGNNGRLSVSLPGPDVLPALQVTKKDADDASKTLGGAGFALYVDTNGNGRFDEGANQPDQPMVSDGSNVDEVTTGKDGIALFAPGTYTFTPDTTYFLVETQAPGGYQLMDGAVKIVFSENDGSDENYPVDTYPFKAAIKFPGENEATVYCEELTAPGEGTKYQVATISVTVSDKAIPSLPATGSNGRTALAATGVAAVTLGAYALWSRRRAFDQ